MKAIRWLIKLFPNIINWWLKAEQGRMEWYHKEITKAYKDKDWERASLLQQEAMRPFGNGLNLF